VTLRTAVVEVLMTAVRLLGGKPAIVRDIRCRDAASPGNRTRDDKNGAQQ
jgi:hypothetical protein